MNSPKQTIVRFLRQTLLLQFVDGLRCIWDQKRNWRNNKAFVETKPDFRLPPPGLAYDAYGHTNRNLYYRSGKEHAEYISALIKAHIDKQSIKIREWGCGPARVIRHIADCFSDRTVDLYGFDYNLQTIEWCRDNIGNITFSCNSIAPPLLCESDVYDCLYCLSVFTHLSIEMHFQWIEELTRVVKPNGLIILATHGDSNREKLMPNEIRAYDQGKLVVRGKVKEGKRISS